MIAITPSTDIQTIGPPGPTESFMEQETEFSLHQEPHGHVTCFFQQVTVPCSLSEWSELVKNLLWVSSLLQTSRGNSLGNNG